MICLIVERYVIGTSEWVVVEIREQDALLDVLKSVGEDDQVKHLIIFCKGNHFQQSGLVSHELTMPWPIIFEVGII